MEIIIGSAVIQIPTHSPFAFGVWFFETIGWLYLVFLFIYGLILFYQNWIRNEYRKKRSYVLLAIDIPKGNEQSPKAVENMFMHLSGAHQPLKFHHKWWVGEVPESFSFEIVSLGGYIQFLIHTADYYRDLIEAIVYAQYPDAEITEVEDYTKKWNIKFPNEKYQLFGSEIILTKKEFYPIITHKEFEDAISQELKDPMASMLESLTRIGPGEELWIQFVVTPADNDWSKNAQAEVDRLIGAKGGGKKTLADWLFDIPNIILDGLNPAPVKVDVFRNEPPNLMLYLTEGEKNDVKAIQHKASKPGFSTKIRYIYVAEKSKFLKQRAYQGIYGAFKQFNSLGLNGLKNDLRIFTGALVWFKKTRYNWRKNKLLYRYKHRGHWLMPGDFGKVFIAEELASLWHFPLETVKAPLVKKTEAKKAEPPISLPVEEGQPLPASEAPTPKTSPPQNLPTS